MMSSDVICLQAVGKDIDCGKLLGQMQELQEYLCSYSACSVPVVDSKLSEVTWAVNQLHEYLLQCIQITMAADRDAYS